LVADKVRVRNQVKRGTVMTQAGFVIALSHGFVAGLLLLGGLGHALLTANYFTLSNVNGGTVYSLTGMAGWCRRPRSESGEERGSEAVVRE
jgi:triacylglycerol esterase/lipase EstA (alpha/beta hydrolase family)